MLIRFSAASPLRPGYTPAPPPTARASARVSPDSVRFSAHGNSPAAQALKDLYLRDTPSTEDDNLKVWEAAFALNNPNINHALALTLGKLPTPHRLEAFQRLVQRLDLDKDGGAWNTLLNHQFDFRSALYTLSDDDKYQAWNSAFKRLPPESTSTMQGYTAYQIATCALECLPIAAARNAIDRLLEAKTLPDTYSVGGFKPFLTTVAMILSDREGFPDNPEKIRQVVLNLASLIPAGTPPANGGAPFDRVPGVLDRAIYDIGQYNNNPRMVQILTRHGTVEQMIAIAAKLKGVPKAQKAEAAGAFLQAYDGRESARLQDALRTAWHILTGASLTAMQEAEIPNPELTLNAFRGAVTNPNALATLVEALKPKP